MGGVDGMSSLGLFSKMKLSVDEKTGKLTGSADSFAQAAEEIYQSSMAAAAKKESEKQSIDKKLEALSSLQTKVADLNGKSAILFKTDPYGNFGVFSNMYANFSSTSTTPVSSLMDLNLASNAHLQEFSLEITQAASYDFTNATTAVTDSKAALNWSGNFTINGHAFNLTPTMNLNDIASLINNHSSDAGVSASVIKVGASDYRLSLQATTTGTPLTIVDGTAGATAGQLPAASGKSASDLAAKFKFNGIAMERSSNSISDVVDGLTLEVKKAEPGTVMKVQLSPDSESIKDAIRGWVKSLNDVMDEVNKNRMSYVDGKLPTDALLLNAEIIHSLDSIIRTNLSTAVSGIGSSNYRYLEQIGVNVDSITNKVSLDEQKLDEVLKNNPTGVQKLFEYHQEVSNNNFLVPEHPDVIPSSIICDNNGNPLTTTVTVNKNMAGQLSATITINGGTYSGQTFNIPSNKIEMRGNLISFKGDDADVLTTNPYKGFQFVCVDASTIANGGSSSTTLQMTQGIGNRMARNLQTTLDTTNGEFTLQKNKFTELQKKLDKTIQLITEKADKAKEKFQKDFARLEAFRQALAPIQNLIDVIMKNKTQN